MNHSKFIARMTPWVVAAALLIPPHAADLATVPVATIGAGTTVKPNLMYLMDTSGSMSWGFMPDWVNDNRNYCKYYFQSNINYGGRACQFGMPPFNSPDFNGIYYNPATRYDPPKNADGTSRIQMNAANTSNWTRVPVDAYGREQFDSADRYNSPPANTVFAAANATINLASGYPDIEYCERSDCSGSSDPKRNVAQNDPSLDDYQFPRSLFAGGTGGTFIYTRYVRNSSPYYYRVSASRYCTDNTGTNCINAPSPTGAYTVPFSYLWCNSANIGATTQCRARRSDDVFFNVSFSGGVVAATPARYSFSVTKAGSASVSTTTSVTAVNLGAEQLLSSPASATGVDGATKRNALAAAIASRISGAAPCGFSATASGNTVTITSNTSTPASAGCNGRTLSFVTSDATATSTRRLSVLVSTGTTYSGAVSAAGTVSGSFGIGSTSNNRNPQITFSIPQAGDVNTSTTTKITRLLYGSGASAVDLLDGTAGVATGRDNATKQASLLNNLASAINAANTVWTASVSGGNLTISRKTPLATPTSFPVTVVWSDTWDPANDGVDHVVTLSPGAGQTGVDGVTIPATRFKRVDIVPGQTYPKSNERTDCVGSTCTYDEEMTNFANWFAYYRTRIQMMKTASTLAFSTVTDAFRVGFMNLVPSSSNWLPVDTFGGTQRTKWFNMVTSQSTGSSTPLREALSRVGRYYAGRQDGINSVLGTPPAPIQFACQQNFTLLTTDGYWNGNGGVKLDGTPIGNHDNDANEALNYPDKDGATRSVEASPPGVWDGYATTQTSGSASTSGSLADVAAYYWKTDLVPDNLPTGVNSVPVGQLASRTPDKAYWQHMVTFTMGLGIDGTLQYDPKYTDPGNTTSDFARIQAGNPSGTTPCLWDPQCRWPVPQPNVDRSVDDLWHAAVNGRGQYFSAQSPTQVVNGLNAALSAIRAVTGSAAAAATSTPVITQADNLVFLTTYRTSWWDGDVKARTIDPATLQLSSSSPWGLDSTSGQEITAATLLNAREWDAQVPGARKIYTRKGDNTLMSFDWASLDSSTRGYFQSKGSLLPQYGALDAAQKAALDNGQNMVNFLRGNRTLGDGVVFRQREFVLGDTVNAAPVYVRQPRRSYTDTGYTDFKRNHQGRRGVLYVAANDGMLHAIDGATGNELWAFIPRQVLPNLYQLASTSYPTTHQFFVDGTPRVEDVYDGTAGRWRTVLVGGLNRGGRGYYALDVTDPDNPGVLWEFCTDSNLCNSTDSDMGFSYGNPVIGKRKRDGRWVVYVASGYSPTGTQPGRVFTLDALTGARLDETTAGVDGLAKLGDYTPTYDTDNTVLNLYGGDLQGNVYKFDTSTNPMSVAQIAKTTAPDGTGQPITTRPIISTCNGRRIVLVGTGRFLGNSDFDETQVQAVYAFRDDLSGAAQVLSTNANMVKQVYNTSTQSWSNFPVGSSKDGWFANFDFDTGERVNVDPFLDTGRFVVPTNIPSRSPRACLIGGESRLYNFDFCNGSIDPTKYPTIRLPSLVVGVTPIKVPSTTTGSSCPVVGASLTVTSDGQVRLDRQSCAPGTPGGDSARRTSWRELM